MKFFLSCLTILLVVVFSCSAERRKRQTVSECNPTSTHDFVIIGAGVAGLSAVVDLYTKRDIKNIVILEARNRIGGRIRTVRHDGVYEDYGAQWVHGARGHDLMTFISQNNLFVSRNEKPSGQDYFYRLNGTMISPSIVQSVGSAWERIRENLDEDYEGSMGQLIKTQFDNWLRSNPQNAEDKRAVFNFYYNDETTEQADELMNVGMEEDSEYEDAPGDQLGLVKNGWLSVLERMTANIPLNTLLKQNAVVKKINWAVSCNAGEDKKVAVYLADGRVIVGNTAIVTLPLGVLKAGSVEFTPALTQRKIAAINKLGFGCAIKVMMFFNQPWWGKSVGSMNAVYMDSINDNVTVRLVNESISKWYRNMVAFNTAYGNDKLLQAWLTGSWARLAESLPLDEVASVVTQVLKKALGKSYQVSDPVNVTKSDWCSDPYTMGAYSYVAVGGRARDFTALAEPLPKNDPILFFAGEATSSDQWACVHGAWSTGVRASRQAASALSDD